jgi:hypothetical protein
MKENEEGRTQEERGVKRINEMGRAQEGVVVSNCLLIREWNSMVVKIVRILNVKQKSINESEERNEEREKKEE